eukprot:GILK01014411.1.p1 GENE.GILK01014411.1~~GILK01014411.1.p1  ORF type:complete len:249 (-),score=23.24 GILK01014411.1:116-862(-)
MSFQPKLTNMSEEIHRSIAAPCSIVRVMTIRRPKPASVQKGFMVNTTSGAKEDWCKELSPFFVGPVHLYADFQSENMENAWQYCKVYPDHADADGNPTEAYWKWAKAGWASKKANRFPMGKGRKPLYSLWDGKRLNYIEARKRIYCPLYAEAVQRTNGYRKLRNLYDEAKTSNRTLTLLDHDGWDYVGQKVTLRQVINFPKPKMGHAFVLAGLLHGDIFWLKSSDGVKKDASSSSQADAEPIDKIQGQ